MALQYKPEVAIEHLAGQDKVMGELIAKVGDFNLDTEFGVSPFQVLLRGIIYQQLSGTAAKAIYDRFLALFAPATDATASELAKLQLHQLQDAGLSKAKILAVQDLAEKTLNGTVPELDELEQMSDADVIERLTEVRGIGEWTVQIMLIFRLGRADVLPSTDLGIRKGYQLAYGTDELPSFGELASIGEQWAPYRTVASWYLWRATDSVDW